MSMLLRLAFLPLHGIGWVLSTVIATAIRTLVAIATGVGVVLFVYWLAERGG